MSKLSQLLGSLRATTSVTHAHSVAGVACAATDQIRLMARQAASGAMTSNTLKTLLSVTGAGECSVLALHAVDGTSRTLRLRVTVDGTVVFDTTSAANSTANSGLIAAGPMGPLNSAGTAQLTTPIRFAASLLVEGASSVTETDKLVLDYILNTY